MATPYLWGDRLAQTHYPTLLLQVAVPECFGTLKKQPFGSGYVDSTQWDDENIGQNSVVFGHSGIADSTAYSYYCVENLIPFEVKAVSLLVGKTIPSIPTPVTVRLLRWWWAIVETPLVMGKSHSNTVPLLEDTSQYHHWKHATILGGANNTISGDYSTALGRDITIDHKGVFVYSNLDTPVESTGDGQFLILPKGMWHFIAAIT